MAPPRKGVYGIQYYCIFLLLKAPKFVFLGFVTFMDSFGIMKDYYCLIGESIKQSFPDFGLFFLLKAAIMSCFVKLVFLPASECPVANISPSQLNPWLRLLLRLTRVDIGLKLVTLLSFLFNLFISSLNLININQIIKSFTLNQY